METVEDGLVDRESLGDDSRALLALCEKLAALLLCTLALRTIFTGNLDGLAPTVQIRRYRKHRDYVQRYVFLAECDLSHQPCTGGTPSHALHAAAWLLYHQLRALDAPPWRLHVWCGELAAEMLLTAYPSVAEAAYDDPGAQGAPWLDAWRARVDVIAPHRDRGLRRGKTADGTAPR